VVKVGTSNQDRTISLKAAVHSCMNKNMIILVSSDNTMPVAGKASPTYSCWGELHINRPVPKHIILCVAGGTFAAWGGGHNTTNTRPN